MNDGIETIPILPRQIENGSIFETICIVCMMSTAVAALGILFFFMLWGAEKVLT